MIVETKMENKQKTDCNKKYKKGRLQHFKTFKKIYKPLSIKKNQYHKTIKRNYTGQGCMPTKTSSRKKIEGVGLLPYSKKLVI